MRLYGLSLLISTCLACQHRPVSCYYGLEPAFGMVGSRDLRRRNFDLVEEDEREAP
jgi:hypothetical protein